MIGSIHRGFGPMIREPLRDGTIAPTDEQEPAFIPKKCLKPRVMGRQGNRFSLVQAEMDRIPPPGPQRPSVVAASQLECGWALFRHAVPAVDHSYCYSDHQQEIAPNKPRCPEKSPPGLGVRTQVRQRR